jgi:hypothetical protein
MAGAAAMVAAGAIIPSARAQGSPIVLFNGKNWEGLYIFIGGEGRDKDSRKVFTIEPGGIIHASGEKFGFVSTDKDYDNYRLTWEFKWGEKRWPPREKDKRDAGVLYHCVGPDKVWNKSLEYQIQEGDCGDMWLTGGEGGAPSLTVLGKTYTGGNVVKWFDNEKPKGEWNHAMLIARGNRIEHFINGKCNLVGTEASLTRGRINWQSEGAEIYYRNLVLEPLK